MRSTCMEDVSLFTQSLQVKREADALLEESRLNPFLQSYGLVQMAGSYSLGLMVNRDIDLYVINSAHTQDSTLEALNESIYILTFSKRN